MDEITKFRITGALIWFALIFFLVPAWYNNPVDYAKVNGQWHADLDDDIDALIAQERALQSGAKREEEKVEVVQQVESSESRTPRSETRVEQSASQSVSQRSASSSSSVPSAIDGETGWFVRLVSYRSEASAQALWQRLDNKGYQASVGEFNSGGQPVYTVRVGPYARRAQALDVKDILDAHFRTDSAVIEVTQPD